MIATELTVKQLENRDPESGVAVIDRDALGDLGVSSGDFVAIRGRDGGRTVARVWPSDTSDAGRGIVRIDGQLRQAANVGTDDRVEVERTAVEPAERITVAPPEDPAAPAVTCGDVGGHRVVVGSPGSASLTVATARFRPRTYRRLDSATAAMRSLPSATNPPW